MQPGRVLVRQEERLLTAEMAPGTSKLARFEAEWITGSYQLIVPELPAQESVKTQHDQYRVELQPSECVNTPQQFARPLVVREGHNKSVRMAVLPH